MNMTQEEVTKRLKALKARCERLIVSSSAGNPEEWRKDAEAIDLALSALRPVSRERVRRGKIIETIKDGRANRVFSCCGRDFTELTCWLIPDFCPACGAPMTDEAVEMVMERLEALNDA